ncbi:MAG: serine--tRNA ligase [Acidobacteria bacterium]|nr:serine--tRNA ligase [Acidobacteriota bacterium]
MLDTRFIRENLEEVRERLAARGAARALDEFEQLDKERRAKVALMEGLRGERNRVTEQVGRLMKGGGTEAAQEFRAQSKELGEKIGELESQVAEIEPRLDLILQSVPNLPHASVPLGPDETHNVEVRRHGAPPQISGSPRDHVEIGTSLGILDLDRAAKIAGARFAVLHGLGARLERALINFMLDVQTKEHGYRETWLPVIVNNDSLYGTGQLPKFALDLFGLKDDRGFWLTPTAEVPLVNLYRQETIEPGGLPIKLTAYTSCFRSEAGSYGKDVRGLIRQHQFDKVELVKLTRPEDSYDELESLVRDAESILQKLGLHYRVVALCTGDIGFASAKTYDIEVWLPSQNRFREISSCSNCEAFQARRAHIKFKREPGAKPEFVHTLNGSGLAVGRTWLAILENYQQPDGSVEVPKVLRPYLDGLDRIEPQMNADKRG